MGALETCNFDLHCHSTISDGTLAPAEIVRRAAANGVTVLALTDHDELAGLAQAAEAARADGIRFVPGVEISVTWADITIHIVGLGIDPANAALGVAPGGPAREPRAPRRADRRRVRRAGHPGTLEGAYGYAENPKLIGRAHFARFLVDCGVARDVASVFRHYLVRGQAGLRAAAVGRPGRRGSVDPRERRPRGRRAPGALQAVARGAGTLPRRVQGGGRRGHRGRDRQPLARRSTSTFARLARELDFLASRGSDFHGPEESHVDLGRLPPLPADLKPVWHDW